MNRAYSCNGSAHEIRMVVPNDCSRTTEASRLLQVECTAPDSAPDRPLHQRNQTPRWPTDATSHPAEALLFPSRKPRPYLLMSSPDAIKLRFTIVSPICAVGKLPEDRLGLTQAEPEAAPPALSRFIAGSM